jgi:hypothetical protein
MKFLLSALLLVLLVGSSFGAEAYTANIYVTNTPVDSATFTVNGDVRTWKETATAITHIALNPAGNTAVNASNLFSNIVGNQFIGPLYSSQAGTNQVRLIGGSGQALAVTVPSEWGYVTITTNAATAGYPVRIPLLAEPTGSVRTNVAAQLVHGINTFATNRLSTSVLSQDVVLTNGNQSISGVKSFMTNMFINESTVNGLSLETVGVIVTGTTAGKNLGINYLTCSNSTNPTLMIRNWSPTGSSQINFLDSLGAGVGSIGVLNSASNMVINAVPTTKAVIIQVNSVDLIRVMAGAITNTVPAFHITGTNSASAYKVGGVLGLSQTITNVVDGVTNAYVFGAGILTNQFQIAP